MTPDPAPNPPPDALYLPATAAAALTALPPLPLWEIVPFRAGAEALAEAFTDAFAGPPPGPGESRAVPGGRLLHAGLDRWLLRGPAAPPDLGAAAAVVDQSDAFAGLALRGPAAAEILARLLPLDLAPAAFPPDAVATSALRRTPCLVLAIPDGFELLVPRSFAATVAADLAEAARAVAARAEIGAAPA